MSLAVGGSDVALHCVCCGWALVRGRVRGGDVGSVSDARALPALTCPGRSPLSSASAGALERRDLRWFGGVVMPEPVGHALAVCALLVASTIVPAEKTLLMFAASYHAAMWLNAATRPLVELAQLLLVGVRE